MFDIRPFQPKRLKALLDLPRRMRRLHRVVAYAAARELKAHLEAGMERIPETERYADRVTIRRVRAKVPVFVVMPTAKARRAEELPADRTVVYVYPRGALAKPSGVQVLSRFNPWPLDQMPFTPSRKEAHLVFRRVSSRELQAVRVRRRDDAPQWRPALLQLGIRVEKLELPSGVSLRPDLYFQALRVEFGGSSAKAYPHWRPALRAVVPSLRAWLTANAARVLTLSDARAAKEVPRLRPASPRMATGLGPFVERVGRVR